ncbi:hypothetical protein MKX01_016981 [Papaver californicum]|nr:hypothetical protein MKX01_016981 [Papaver californicum]
MGTASKLSMLLTSPFPLLCSRPSIIRLSRVSIASLSSSSSSRCRFYLNSRRIRLGFSIKSSESSSIHTQTTSVIKEDYHLDSLGSFSNSRGTHPWPEWSKFIENLTTSGYLDRQSLDEFEKISDEFKPAANACLSFAFDQSHLLGSLSRKDIEVVVANGSPFMFEGAVDSEKGIKSFLRGDDNSNLEQREGMVGLMRYILSYTCHSPTTSVDKYTINRELVESSVRRLLDELSDASRKGQEVDLSGSMPMQFRDKYGQKPRPLGRNIEMKRGDWICSRCSFMNFAKNMRCLECDEARPKRLLTGGEWQCPQCSFYNYGRNVVCLRCDCKCPSETTPAPRSGSGFTNEINQIRASQANNSSGFTKPINDGPEIMPLRKGVNRFVVSTRKKPLERNSADDQYQASFGNDTTVGGSGFQSEDVVGSRKTSESSINQSLDRILGRISSAPEKNGGKVTIEKNSAGSAKTSVSNSASSSFRQSEGSGSNYVPFVPLPADIFAKPQEPEKDKKVTYHNANMVKADEQLASSLPSESGDSLLLNGKPVNQIVSKEEKEQAEKSERWFKKVAELHDVTDIASAISDDDFPKIMPMRKGENRFVVSKKDMSLTSPLYKRRMAMEQTNNTNFVPFVPFPPDYFAKKDKVQEPLESATSTDASSSTSVVKGGTQKSKELNADTPSHGAGNNSTEMQDYQPASRSSLNTPSFTKNSSENKSDSFQDGSARNSTQIPSEDWISPSWKKSNNMSEAAPSPRSSIQDQPMRTQNSGTTADRGFSGRSLEGSLVTEPDPLDMSEEAKAERWFRRAAQIKDISELSQIPDEDFPSIMPMRKGVNRFVVSKRKTPLERRLTSPQYRRNLPIVSSESSKKEENDTS